jgi:hypothetical protein
MRFRLSFSVKPDNITHEPAVPIYTTAEVLKVKHPKLED